jgi:hypothetical protein
MPSYTQGDGIPDVEQRVEAAHKPGGGVLQMRMTGRVHRSLMKDDGELHQKVSQLPGESRDCLSWPAR